MTKRKAKTTEYGVGQSAISAAGFKQHSKNVNTATFVVVGTASYTYN